MSDEQKLLNDLVKYVERNYDGFIGVGDDEFILRTDEEVFVISIRKDTLDDWGF